MPDKDTIIIKAPAGTKARWVRMSQREGKKLSDWVFEKMSLTMPKIYKITAAVADQYHGSGWALVAVSGGQIVTLRYLDDVADDAVCNKIRERVGEAKVTVTKWLDTPTAGAVVRELQALGEVSVGMCSAWEFIEL